jgi:hypothetical protein
MSAGSWPFYPQQCPRCAYFQPSSPPFVDDSGYEILGFCRHPRIAMELFEPQKRTKSDAEPCRLFVEADQREARGPTPSPVQ